MYISHPPTPSVRHKPHRFSSPFVSASSYSGLKTATGATIQEDIDGMKERIRRLFNKVELSVSSYDTAWVAMVPSPNYSLAPCFPECLDWLLDNQLEDGSWGLSPHTPLLLKVTLSSTLASVLALKRWGVGQSHINKGLHFMELNFPSAIDKSQHSPTGFDIIFPGMLDNAKDLELKLPLEPTVFDALLRNRELELKRCYESQPKEREKYLAYVSEGIGKSQDWEMVMKYQRKNGSFFNSPATTAVVLSHHLQNSGCLNYIRSLLGKFGNAVPTVYPLDMYLRLCMIDSLEKLGIDWHFRDEIQSVLDETYSCWLQSDEQIFMDLPTCALAFRLLRVKGYDVSSDALTRIAEEDCYLNLLGGHLNGISDALELYRASQMIISPDESTLRKQNMKSNHYLKQMLSGDSLCSDMLTRYFSQEANDALKFSLCASLERGASRRNIEQYNILGVIRVLKTSYCSSNIGNKDFINLAVEDFNKCQSMHREEIGHLERWVIEKRLDRLKFARQKSAYCGFSAVATIFTPELADARMAWSIGGVLTTVTDDLFDGGGSPEELLNLVHLFEKNKTLDVNIESDCCSEEVGIIFSAIHASITEFADKAFICQGRNVTSHLVEIWSDLLKAWTREAEWSGNRYVPTLDEYLQNAYITFALGPIVVPALYFVGPQLSEEVVRSFEIKKMFELMSTCGRLLNDIQTFKRDAEQGKLNAITLLMINSGMTKEEATEEALRMAERNKEEMLSLFVKEKGSVVPRACKELFWKMTKVVHQFYSNDDGFTLPHMMKDVKEIIYEPILGARV